MITDKLASYGAAMRETLRSVEHRQHKRLNNRAENSHQPTRQRERAMRIGRIRRHFCPGRHRLTAEAYRQDRLRRLHEWDEITRPPAVA